MATYGFVSAPDHTDTPGNGSFLFDVPAGERSWILTDQYGSGEWHGEPDAKQGAKLEDITALFYSTYITPGSAVLVPAMGFYLMRKCGNKNEKIPLVLNFLTDKSIRITKQTRVSTRSSKLSRQEKKSLITIVT